MAQQQNGDADAPATPVRRRRGVLQHSPFVHSAGSIFDDSGSWTGASSISHAGSQLPLGDASAGSDAGRRTVALGDTAAIPDGIVRREAARIESTSSQVSVSVHQSDAGSRPIAGPDNGEIPVLTDQQPLPAPVGPSPAALLQGRLRSLATLLWASATDA